MGESDGNEHIHVVVGEGQKDRWNYHLEQFEKYDSMADLVRTAVEEQIATDVQGGVVSGAVESMHEEVLAELKELKGRMMTANEALETLQHGQLSEDAVDRIVETHTDLIQEQLESMETDGDGEDE